MLAYLLQDTFCERQSHHIFPISNREWVTLHIFWKSVSSHLLLSPTESEWHCTFCERQSHYISSMTNRLWALTLHDIVWMQSHHIFSHDPQDVSDTQCTSFKGQSHHILPYNQQRVGDIAHFVKGSLITSFPMTNSLWVTLHILWKAVSSHPFLWPTACEDIAHFVNGPSLITSFQPITGTNSLWVTLHFCGRQSHHNLFLWPLEGEWHCTFCGRQSHHNLFYD